MSIGGRKLKATLAPPAVATAASQAPKPAAKRPARVADRPVAPVAADPPAASNTSALAYQPFIIGKGENLVPAESPELPALINYIRDGRCVLFVGAGLSRSAGLPSWHQLMERLVEPSVALRAGAALEQELRSLLDKGRYPELAGHCRELLGSREFYNIVHRELQPCKEVPQIYREIVSTPYACIVTTNFDTLLEDAFARWDERGIPKTPTGVDLAQQGTLLLDGAFFVLKAHGDLDDPQSMIFTAEDYRRVIHANPAFQAVLNSILLTHAVLFVGYSLSDPNFRLLLDSQLTIFNEEVPPRYAVMGEVGKVEQDILWRTARIRVLPYKAGEHQEVGRFLHTLWDRVRQHAVKSSVSAPAAAPAVPVRCTLGLPYRLPTATLAIRGRGERLDFDIPRTGWRHRTDLLRRRAPAGPA